MLFAVMLTCSLPKVVKRRIKALKRLQAEANRVESRFYEEVHALECAYAAKYEPFLQKVRTLNICPVRAIPTEGVHFEFYRRLALLIFCSV